MIKLEEEWAAQEAAGTLENWVERAQKAFPLVNPLTLVPYRDAGWTLKQLLDYRAANDPVWYQSCIANYEFKLSIEESVTAKIRSRRKSWRNRSLSYSQEHGNDVKLQKSRDRIDHVLSKSNEQDAPSGDDDVRLRRAQARMDRILAKSNEQDTPSGGDDVRLKSAQARMDRMLAKSHRQDKPSDNDKSELNRTPAQKELKPMSRLRNNAVSNDDASLVDAVGKTANQIIIRSGVELTNHHTKSLIQDDSLARKRTSDLPKKGHLSTEGNVKVRKRSTLLEEETDSNEVENEATRMAALEARRRAALLEEEEEEEEETDSDEVENEATRMAALEARRRAALLEEEEEEEEETDSDEVENEATRMAALEARRRAALLDKEEEEADSDEVEDETTSVVTFEAKKRAAMLKEARDSPLTRGTKIKVYWEEDDEWYDGTIVDHCEGDGKFCVKYDINGNSEWEDLNVPKFEVKAPFEKGEKRNSDGVPDKLVESVTLLQKKEKTDSNDIEDKTIRISMLETAPSEEEVNEINFNMASMQVESDEKMLRPSPQIVPIIGQILSLEEIVGAKWHDGAIPSQRESDDKFNIKYNGLEETKWEDLNSSNCDVTAPINTLDAVPRTVKKTDDTVDCEEDPQLIHQARQSPEQEKWVTATDEEATTARHGQKDHFQSHFSDSSVRGGTGDELMVISALENSTVRKNFLPASSMPVGISENESDVNGKIGDTNTKTTEQMCHENLLPPGNIHSATSRKVISIVAPDQLCDIKTPPGLFHRASDSLKSSIMRSLPTIDSDEIPHLNDHKNSTLQRKATSADNQPLPIDCATSCTTPIPKVIEKNMKATVWKYLMTIFSSGRLVRFVEKARVK